MNQENFRLPEFSTGGAIIRAPQSSRRDLLEQNKLAHLPFCFIGMRLVCDECSLPLKIYGENYIESYINGRANLLRCLCDLHAAELDLEEAK